MRYLVVVTLAIVSLGQSIVAAADGDFVKKQSPYGVAETLDRLENILTEKGLTVFTRVDHAAGAEKAGMEMADEQLLLFGNPKMGTPLMKSNPMVGIDLPMKALAYEDADGVVWLVYNAPAAVSARHGLEGQDEIIGKMTGALDKLTNAAIAK